MGHHRCSQLNDIGKCSNRIVHEEYIFAVYGRDGNDRQQNAEMEQRPVMEDAFDPMICWLGERANPAKLKIYQDNRYRVPCHGDALLVSDVPQAKRFNDILCRLLKISARFYRPQNCHVILLILLYGRRIQTLDGVVGNEPDVISNCLLTEEKWIGSQQT